MNTRITIPKRIVTFEELGDIQANEMADFDLLPDNRFEITFKPVKWFLATNITILMRKTFAFRRIGKHLYYRPLKSKGLLVDKIV
jgi:hypothetical protein